MGFIAPKHEGAKQFYRTLRVAEGLASSLILTNTEACLQLVQYDFAVSAMWQYFT